MNYSSSGDQQILCQSASAANSTSANTRVPKVFDTYIKHGFSKTSKHVGKLPLAFKIAFGF